MLVDPITRTEIMKLLHSGRTISAIARTLGLPEGTVHDAIVDYWAEDKERATQSVKAAAIRRWRGASYVDGGNDLERDGE